MKSHPIFLFYLLVIYIFASFLWWSYLLLKKNSDSFHERVQLEKIRHDHLHGLDETSQDYYQTQGFHAIKKRYERQKLMIASEGLVFLFLLAAGSFRLWQTFRKEINLARQQNNFLLSITHELRSPLASMKLSLQTLLKRTVMDDKFRKLIENSVEDVDRLSTLVDNILYAVRMEDRAFSLHKEVENISEITNDILQRIQAVHKDTVSLKADIGENILFKTERLAFASVVQNLVENAIKYSKGRANIEVSLCQKDGSVMLEVKDKGIGIPENQRSLVFKKFYRIGNEETRNTKGTGLGLFIVKRVTDLHHGKVTISANQPQGTVVRVVLPGAKQ